MEHWWYNVKFFTFAELLEELGHLHDTRTLAIYPDSSDFLSSFNKDFIGWGRSSNNLNLDSTNLEKRKRWGWNALAKELVLLNWKIWVMTSLRADSTKFI